MKILILAITSCTLLFACKLTKPMKPYSAISTHPLRLKPGQDLRYEIENFVKLQNIKAGWVATCVGSLTNYNIRFANQQNGNAGTGFFEIVSLVGTLSTNGCHIHIAVSDSTGKTIGGHLLAGNIVYTTAEIVLHSDSNFIFKREKDGSTPWQELQIETIKTAP